VQRRGALLFKATKPKPMEVRLTETIDALASMTRSKWDAMPRRERDKIRDISSMSPQLIGLEGWQVEVIDMEDDRPRKFIVGRSSDWRPVHLELATRRSRSGDIAELEYKTVRKIRKVRRPRA